MNSFVGLVRLFVKAMFFAVAVFANAAFADKQIISADPAACFRRERSSSFNRNQLLYGSREF